MKTGSFRINVLVLLGALALPAGDATAHTVLLSPNGGETLEVGSTFEISWTVAIEHPIEGWDLWYSTTSPDGPWITIALGLPPGDPREDSEHTYQWTVPDAVDDTAWIRVRQDGTDGEWFDVSDGSFSIVAAGCVGDVDASGTIDFDDLLAVLAAWGPCEGGCSADLDASGFVDFDDLLIVLGAWGPCP